MDTRRDKLVALQSFANIETGELDLSKFVYENTLYEKAAELIAKEGIEVKKGVFAADMQVFSQNDGPINFLIDSKKLF